MIFGEAKLIRLAPMGDNEPESIEKPSFRADSSFNVLAKLGRKHKRSFTGGEEADTEERKFRTSFDVRR